MESPPRSSSPDVEEEFRRRRQQQQQQAAAAAYHAQQQAAYQAQQQQQQKILELKLQKHVQSYPINLKFPAKVFAHTTTTTTESVPNGGKTNKTKEEGRGTTKKQLRTDTEFVNFRLLEAGITFEETRALEDVTNKIGDFIRDMEGTGCYHSVQVVLGRKDDDNDVEETAKDDGSSGGSGQQPPHPPSTHVDVILNERNWYKLYIGGGIKHDGALSSMSSSTTSSTSSVPKLQFESSASLLNLTGSCDKSTLSYTLDQTNTGTLSVTHDRPLFTLFPKFSDLYDFILTNEMFGNGGSQMNIQFRGLVDTLDFESTRSVKEYQRVLGMKIRNGTGGGSGGGMAEMSTKPYQSIDWSLTFRDLIPRRHRTIPYLSDASPQIITSSSGPNMKHSLTYEYRMNGNQCDDIYNPTSGYDCKFNFELACPPGDVGFVKGYGGLAIHLPIVPLPPSSSSMEGGSNGAVTTKVGGRKSGNNFVTSILGGLSLHGCINGGLLHPLSYGGLCNNNNTSGKTGNLTSGTTTCLSDRFYVGGPLQLRGFVPGGIGPRAETGGESTPGGDALGGNFYYTATLAASIPFPAITFLRNNNVRLMGFANIGTLVDTTVNGGGGSVMPSPWMSIVRSTRAAFGGGISVGTAMGRLEATYAVPIRYGRMDARRSVQAGLGFSFG